ncbi:MAG: DUF420 domain-containing protein [Bacteroidota bacterium]
MEKVLTDNRSYLKIIYILSAVIPLAVAFLIFFPLKGAYLGSWVKLLPGFHAMINSLTAVLMIAALVAIKKGHVQLHRNLMFVCLFLGLLFLVSYILYHSNVESVKFGDSNHDGMVSDKEKELVGSVRVTYLGILASHILLSIIVVPFVLLAFYYSLTNQIQKHRKIVKFAFPVWLYVSITGVVVYFMIKPYYF